MKHLDINISGIVQGVGFRYFVDKQASMLNIKGLVKNLPNGKVYIEAEAQEENLSKFLEACRQGPNFSKVGKVEIAENKLKNFSDFKIEY